MCPNPYFFFDYGSADQQRPADDQYHPDLQELHRASEQSARPSCHPQLDVHGNIHYTHRTQSRNARDDAR